MLPESDEINIFPLIVICRRWPPSSRWLAIWTLRANSETFNFLSWVCKRQAFNERGYTKSAAVQLAYLKTFLRWLALGKYGGGAGWPNRRHASHHVEMKTLDPVRCRRRSYGRRLLSSFLQIFSPWKGPFNSLGVTKFDTLWKLAERHDWLELGKELKLICCGRVGGTKKYHFVESNWW